ncbi:phosphate propanoyltransferase [Heliobacterium chlorum]|uniref:Phosphate propanoyltransferase n=1 Tax=Heliobacterium chlorum TaxID=2698 RepID=A0ABR7T151_HELCL|nr:phosphate propanoyltransferase [Heliobacterium chlorum]
MEQVVAQVLIALKDRLPELESASRTIRVGISNRHIHLSNEHVEILFGAGHQLKKLKDLAQEGEFAAEETVTLVGPKGVIRGVRVLGPLRKTTQVEISRTDAFGLGIKAPVRDSGQIEGSAGITIVGPCGSITLTEGVIMAARHIHMHPDDAAFFGLKDQDRVSIETTGTRGIVFKNVLIRVHPKFRLEMHLDVDEANAAELNNNDAVQLVRQS